MTGLPQSADGFTRARHRRVGAPWPRSGPVGRCARALEPRRGEPAPAGGGAGPDPRPVRGVCLRRRDHPGRALRAPRVDVDHRGPDRRLRPAGRRGRTILGVAHRARGLGSVRGVQPLPAGRRGRRGDVSRGRARRRHADSARSRAPASPGRRQRPRRGHHLRHHRARGDRRPPRRGQRPLHQPAGCGRRPRLSRARAPRRPDRRSCSRAPAATGCSAAQNPTPR